MHGRIVRSGQDLNQGLFSKDFSCRQVKTRACLAWVNSLPNDKTLAVSKLKAFADKILNVTQNIKFVFHMAENLD